MTERNHQRAARNYMRLHPGVPYMEALRRVERTQTPRGPGALPSVLLGYRASEQGTDTTSPVSLTATMERPLRIAIVGDPGTGKTVLAREILRQWQGRTVVAVTKGDLLGEISPWEGLVESTLIDAVQPPAVDELPLGALIVQDLSLSLRATPFDTNGWEGFMNMATRMARAKGMVSVVTLPAQQKGEMIEDPQGWTVISTPEPSPRSGPWTYQVENPAEGAPCRFALSSPEGAPLPL